ncbi:hypothetical protein FSW04_19445 [Baekduia soli]|uniref:Uncharacterized protein n=1 Tax=Baekduia soli TaxID=496014 RepID=A0A5B8U8R0_9ACTN|nr:hypothetical protein [Baekduia soli]QEC49529.1 hypothetical protein FSW04_19445 [Baekduia soli]
MIDHALPRPAAVRRRGLLAASALLVAAAVAAAPAEAGVSTPKVVSPRGLVVQESAVGAGGGRVAVLMGGLAATVRGSAGSVQARIGPASRLGHPQRLGTGGTGLRVAVGADGTAVAAWITHARGGPAVLQVAVARAGHGFGRAQAISRAGSLALGGVGVTPSGRAAVTWRRGVSGTPVLLAVAAPGGAFGAPQPLGTSRQYAPALAVGPDGTIVVAWLDTPPAPQPPPAPAPATRTARVLAVTLVPGASTATPAAELGTLAFWFSGPEAAAGPGGTAVTWRQTGTGKLLSSPSAPGAFGTPVALPPAPYAADQGDHLALALPGDGTQVALWREVRTRSAEDPTPTFAVVRASVRPAGGTFAAPVRLSAAGRLAGPPQAIALTGRTVAAWAESGGAAARVRLAVLASGGGWSKRTAPAAPGIDPATLAVAGTPGAAALTWIAHAGSGSRETARLMLAVYHP